MIHSLTFFADDTRCGTGVVAVDTGRLDATAAALADPARPEIAAGPSASAAGQGAADDAVGVDAFDAVRARLRCFRGKGTERTS